jgi:hypothetical protein
MGVFTLNRRFIVNKFLLGEHEKKLFHRLVASGVEDEEFNERFLRRHDVERSLETAARYSPGAYEEELESLVNSALADYEAYVLGWPQEVEEGDIAPLKTPKKKRRVRKPKDIAGARERQAALGQYLAREVSEYETITSFRKDILSGRVLSEEEALTFLSSPLAATKSRAVFKTFRDNPLDQILDANYQVKEDRDDSGPYRKLGWGSGHSSTVRPLGVVGTNPIFPGEVVSDYDLRGLRLREDPTVILPHPQETGRFVVAEPNSVIGELANLAEVSLNGFPISREMGVWFILTGKFISEDPVRIRYVTEHRPYLLSRTTITLEVESWLPPEEVLEQYRHAQHEILGGTPRSLKRKTVDLFEFVNQHKEMTWRELFDAWNEAHPSQRFRDRSHLYTTYKRALDNIASPPTLAELSLTPTAPRPPRSAGRES